MNRVGKNEETENVSNLLNDIKSIKLLMTTSMMGLIIFFVFLLTYAAVVKGPQQRIYLRR